MKSVFLKTWLLFFALASAVQAPAFAQDTYFHYAPAMRDLMRGWNQFPAAELCASKDTNLSAAKDLSESHRSEACDPWPALALDRSREDRRWHPARGGWIACAEEVPGAQEVIDQSAFKIFTIPQGREWLNKRFACDEKLLQHFLGVSAAGASKIQELCDPQAKPTKIKLGPNFMGTPHDFFAKIARLYSERRKIFFLLGATPLDCVDSYTFNQGPSVYGLPTGKLDPESFRKFFLHEMLIAFDAKNPYPVSDAHAPKSVHSRYSLVSGHHRLQVAAAALRAFVAERNILRDQGEGSDLDARPEMRLVKGIEQDEAACLTAFEKMLNVVQGIPNGWISSESVSYGLAWGSRIYKGPAVTDPGADFWNAKSGAEIMAEFRRLSAADKKGDFCRYLVTPDLSGVNLLDSQGPRPRIGGSD